MDAPDNAYKLTDTFPFDFLPSGLSRFISAACNIKDGLSRFLFVIPAELGFRKCEMSRVALLIFFFWSNRLLLRLGICFTPTSHTDRINFSLVLALPMIETKLSRLF